jgi:hypothetical protein
MCRTCKHVIEFVTGDVGADTTYVNAADTAHRERRDRSIVNT